MLQTTIRIVMIIIIGVIITIIITIKTIILITKAITVITTAVFVFISILKYVKCVKDERLVSPKR